MSTQQQVLSTEYSVLGTENQEPSGPPILWWTGLESPIVVAVPVPPRADVVIVGGGYTGLAASRALARSGARTVLLERETLGWGASSRNGGMVLPGYKAELSDLVRRQGLARARQLFQDSLEAVDLVESLAQDEGMECDWHRSGHLTLAAKPSHLRGLEQTARLLARDFGYQTEVLSAGDLPREIGSTRYHGGLLDPRAGAIQPAAFLAGLAGSALRAGAVIVERCGVESLRQDPKGFVLETTRGPIAAREALIATNGYTGRLVPWLARRVVPVGSFIIATAPLPADLRSRLMPTGRMMSDTRNLLYYFRLSPDGRIVFGGRAAFVPTALEESRALLYAGLLEVFPDLAGVPIEYAWGGTLGFTLDHLPHAGQRDGIAYAMGYGGHGVALATWLGHRVGEAMAGQGHWPELSRIPFRAIPFYSGRPWFLPLAGTYYGLKDRLG